MGTWLRIKHLLTQENETHTQEKVCPVLHDVPNSFWPKDYSTGTSMRVDAVAL